MIRILMTMGFLVMIAAFPARVAAADPRIIDGDTLELDGERIRLHGIDAPELDQPCGAGPEAAAAHRRLWRQRDRASRDDGCVARGHDGYARTIARCYVDNRDVAAELVRQGWAFDWPRYSGGAYADEQARARAAGRGVWARGCARPWEYRHDG